MTWKVVAKIIMSVARISSSNCTVLSAILQIFYEFLIFLWLVSRPFMRVKQQQHMKICEIFVNIVWGYCAITSLPWNSEYKHRDYTESSIFGGLIHRGMVRLYSEGLYTEPLMCPEFFTPVKRSVNFSRFIINNTPPYIGNNFCGSILMNLYTGGLIYCGGRVG